MTLLLLIGKWNSTFLSNLREKTDTGILENLELKESRSTLTCWREWRKSRKLSLDLTHVEYWSGGFNTTYLIESEIGVVKNCQDTEIQNNWTLFSYKQSTSNSPMTHLFEVDILFIPKHI